jgi:uncharacterized membrane protein
VDDFDWYRLFKTLHVIAVILLGGAVVLESIVGALVARAKTAQEARIYAQLLYIAENYISIPAVIAIAVFGYATADRIGYDLDITWLALGQVLFYAAIILVLAFLRPAANKLYRLTRQAPDGPLTPEITAELQNKTPTIVGPLASLIFVTIVYLMVAKPGW